MSEPNELSELEKEVEKALTDAWTNYRVLPGVMWYGASFGVVAITKQGFFLVESFSDSGRQLTPDELALFKKEVPVLFE